jgi:hypothetical protein
MNCSIFGLFYFKKKIFCLCMLWWVGAYFVHAVHLVKEIILAYAMYSPSQFAFGKKHLLVVIYKHLIWLAFMFISSYFLSWYSFSTRWIPISHHGTFFLGKDLSTAGCTEKRKNRWGPSYPETIPGAASHRSLTRALSLPRTPPARGDRRRTAAAAQMPAR